MATPTLTINDGKPTEFEFDVMIQGASVHESAVRFVVESAGYDVVVNCARGRNDKWVAKIPALDLQESEPKYRVEVITGGYFFCPTSGALSVIHQPRVRLAESMEKTQIRSDRIERPKGKTSALELAMEQAVGDAMNAVEVPLVETMSVAGRLNLQKKCNSAGRIFTRAGEIMEDIAVRDHRKMTSRALASVLEAVKKAVRSIEE